MDQVVIVVHCTLKDWWADSPDLPGWTAVADTLAELLPLAREGAEFAAGGPVDARFKHANGRVPVVAVSGEWDGA